MEVPLLGYDKNGAYRDNVGGDEEHFKGISVPRAQKVLGRMADNAMNSHDDVNGVLKIANSKRCAFF